MRAKLNQRIASANRGQWLRFSIIALLYILFVIWDNNYWLLLGLPLIFDIYISRVIPWDGWKKSKNASVRKIAEWIDAIVFALIAVYFINIFIFQNYKIPTSSLEKTLLVGDYLFVSKVNYGPRVPNTPIAFPLTHHTLPVLNCKSYSDVPYWDYKRLKGFENIKRGDIVVFNFPAGDTVALNVQNEDYYEIISYRAPREVVHNNPQTYGKVVYRPVDRRENYVKRCVGLPGDSLQIIDNQVYINGEKQPTPKHAQFNYFVETNGQYWTEKQFRKLEVSQNDRLIVNNPSISDFFGIAPNELGQYNPLYRLPLTQAAVDYIKQSGWAKSVHIEPADFSGRVYPYGYDSGWTRDNFGAVRIPKRGETVALTDLNVALYKRCIVNYENNTWRQEGDQIYINDQAADSYTFKQDYYFMMGDNRHNSADSRFWGFVPEDHIVGKPILIWLSLDNDRGWFDGKIRWNRIFRTVSAQ